MHYKEAVVNGVMCYKTTPNGMWKTFTPKQLTQKLVFSQKRQETLEQLMLQLKAEIIAERQEITNRD